MEGFVDSLKKFWYFILCHWIGARWSIYEFLHPHKPFDLKKVGKRTGEVGVITGGGRGIGLEVVKKLLQCDMHVIMGCRSVSTGKKVIEEIRKGGITSGQVECLQLDLLSFDSVRNFAKEVLAKNVPIHILFNNAGIMAVPYQLSEDGYESQIQVNFLSHFLLTNLLLEKLKATTESERRIVRIVNTSSIAVYGGELYFHDFQKSGLYSQYKTYLDAKLFVLASQNCLSRRLKVEGSKVHVYTLHPGIIDTGLWEHAPFFVKWFMALVQSLFRTPSEGADNVMYAALSPEIEDESGIWLINSQIQESVSQAEDKAAQNKLWETAAQIVGISSKSS